MLGVGTLTAFVTALVSIRWLLRYVSKHSFEAFAWYRIVLGILVVLVMFSAVLPGILWLRQGAPGLPVFPISALAYVPYAALPIVPSELAICQPLLNTLLAKDPSQRFGSAREAIEALQQVLGAVIEAAQNDEVSALAS